MSDEIEAVEETEEVTGIRASLDNVIGETEASDLDDFDPPLYDDPEEDVEIEANETEVETKTEVETENKTDIASDAPTETPELAVANNTEKPPLDWGVEVREEWKNLPANVKTHLHARDQHVNTMLREGAENRKMGENFLNISAPYKAIMEAEGATSPLNAVENLFKTVGTLRMGSAQDKAATIAKLVQVYGVDIETLDNALVGEVKEHSVDPTEALIDQRMAPVNELLAKINESTALQKQQQEQAVTQDIDSFSKDAEFFNDVRFDMADLLDAAAKRNVSMTMQDAYNKACAIHPQISNVMAQRAANNNLMGNKNNIAAKRNAASSINSNTGRQPVATSNNLRGALMDAFNDHT